MSRSLQAALFLLGAAVFAWLVSRIGIATLAADLAAVGWLFVPIVLLHAVAYLCNAWAWQGIITDEPSRPSFPRLYAITVTGFAINFVTPIVNAGGEPYRIAALAPYVGMRRATGSVVIYTMVHALTSLAFWATALVVALFLAPAYATPLLAALAATLALMLLVLMAFRHGGLERMLRVLLRFPGIGRIIAPAAKRSDALAAIDEQIRRFYTHPWRLTAALGADLLGRFVAAFELCLMAAGIGVGVSYLQASVASGISALVINAFFLVPFELGSREGAYFLAFQLLGFDERIGVFAGIASRLRELAWIAIGLGLLVLPLSGKREERRATPTRLSREASS